MFRRRGLWKTRTRPSRRARSSATRPVASVEASSKTSTSRKPPPRPNSPRMASTVGARLASSLSAGTTTEKLGVTWSSRDSRDGGDRTRAARRPRGGGGRGGGPGGGRPPPRPGRAGGAGGGGRGGGEGGGGA